MSPQVCRACGALLRESFCDLGVQPLSNAYLTSSQLDFPENVYPLHAYVCSECWLVQLPEIKKPDEIFNSDYAYFSSYSDSWLSHCRQYVEHMIDRFGYDNRSRVVEIASNDGYLLQFFQQRGVPVLGIEPAANCADAARAKGIPTRVEFFGTPVARRLVAESPRPDLVLGNNVLAHVPNLNDFVAGLALLVSDHGVVTMEFPHLLELMRGNQFDTIYHEHYSYFSLSAVERVFTRHQLVIFDVQRLDTHGGSLRIFARHARDGSKPVADAVAQLRELEITEGLEQLQRYRKFCDAVAQTRRQLLHFLTEARRQGKKVWAYGAAAKGNTLLNFCGVRGHLIEAAADRSPHKQGKFMPGSHIPICAPDQLLEARPDYVLVLPWNLRDEIVQQLSAIRTWGGRFVLPIPDLLVLP
jgi:hypothetical protein